MSSLELVKIMEGHNQWILTVNSQKFCDFCRKTCEEGYFCAENQKIWHKSCFKEINFKCGCRNWGEHQDYCVIVKIKKGDKDEKK